MRNRGRTFGRAVAGESVGVAMLEGSAWLRQILDELRADKSKLEFMQEVLGR